MRRHGVLTDRMNRPLRIALYVLAIPALLFGIQAALTAPCSTVPTRVEGGSMSPRIAPRQMIQIVKGPPECLGTLKAGDVVLFHSDSSDVPLIKALRGLPGDKLAVKDSRILVNGKPAANSAGEPYRLSPPRAAMIGLYVHDYRGVIPPDSFLVMGENPAGSLDSSRFGLISRAAIIGKAVEADHSPPPIFHRADGNQGEAPSGIHRQ